MSGIPVPSGHGYAEIPLGQIAGKPIKFVHVYQAEEALNVDLEFEDKFVLEMIFRVGFSASVKLLENDNGNYRIYRQIMLKHRPE
jgi:hypothetical protein